MNITRTGLPHPLASTHCEKRGSHTAYQLVVLQHIHDMPNAGGFPPRYTVVRTSQWSHATAKLHAQKNANKYRTPDSSEQQILRYRERPGSNLGPEIGYHDRIFVVFPPGKLMVKFPCVLHDVVWEGWRYSTHSVYARTLTRAEHGKIDLGRSAHHRQDIS
jgi:hypothetical protein